MDEEEVRSVGRGTAKEGGVKDRREVEREVRKEPERASIRTM